MTQNDIVFLANQVYLEIAMDVELEYRNQEVVLDKNTKKYDVDALNTITDNTLWLGVINILDDEGYSISDIFTEEEKGVFTVGVYEDPIVDRWLSNNDGKTIYFVRQVIPDIEMLDSRLQLIIMDALLEGMMYYTEGQIPTQVDAAVANTSYQRYYNARKQLKETFSQKPII
jgi:hypothetical protein